MRKAIDTALTPTRFPTYESILELLENMKEKESQCNVFPNFKATFLPYRSEMVRRLRNQVKRLEVDVRVGFLALIYMDSTLSKVDVKEEGLQLIATCCLYLASKFVV